MLERKRSIEEEGLAPATAEIPGAYFASREVSILINGERRRSTTSAPTSCVNLASRCASDDLQVVAIINPSFCDLAGAALRLRNCNVRDRCRPRCNRERYPCLDVEEEKA